MPELPEVETLRRGLEAHLPGRQIIRVVVANSKVLKDQSEALFRERLLGATVGNVARRGKYLLLAVSPNRLTPFILSDPDVAAVPPPTCLCVHLKMRGQLLLERTSALPGKYHCVSLGLNDGRDLRFYDMWTWGEMRALTEAELATSTGLAGMGREPLEAGWGAGDLAGVLAERKTAIKPLLLDQRILAGVGNIYADESLYRAGIHPERPAMSLAANEVERLASALRTVLNEAVGNGGTTSDNYVDAHGAPGRYVPRVYDRGGQPCPACGTVLSRIRLGGRGTVFCARCQA